MAGSVNKVILVGNLGRDPEARTMQNGGKVVSFSIATSETWNDKMSGERKEKTQWHRIAIFNEKLGDRGATQRGQVRAAAESLAQVVRDRTQIGS